MMTESRRQKLNQIGGNPHAAALALVDMRPRSLSSAGDRFDTLRLAPSPLLPDPEPGVCRQQPSEHRSVHWLSLAVQHGNCPIVTGRGSRKC
jgi:hypothetical protein